MKSLRKTQLLLWNLITAPEGVESALKKNPVKNFPIKGDARLSAVKRLDIYANMYFYRILEALSEDFKTLLNLIGETQFHNLITDYLIKHPPSHFSLRYVGQHLPIFIRKHKIKKTFPFADDVARLEWEIMSVFDAKNQTTMTREDLGKISPEAWPNTKFILSHACSLLDVNWRVDSIREKLMSSKKFALPKQQKATLKIWRKNLQVFFREISKPEKQVIQLMQKQRSFGQIAEALAKQMSPDKAISTLTQVFQTILNDGNINLS